MSNPTQPDVLNRMIARLEEANARSYSDQSRGDEPSSKSDHDDRPQLPGQTADPRRQLRWVKSWPTAVVLIIIAASAYVMIFVSAPSYIDAVKSRIALWVVPSASQMPPQEREVPVPEVSREIEPRLQRMAGELSELQQQVEQLKASQDLTSRSAEQAAAQFKIDREQMMRDSANVAGQLRVTQEQLRATQAQLAEIVSAETANSGRKLFRRRRLSALSPRARARNSVR